MTPVVVHLQYTIEASHFDIMPDTTAKTEAIPEILEAWIRMQIGKGRDDSVPNDKPTYDIKLLLDLTDDSFRMTHDCGNEALCLGIMMAALNILSKNE
jgi:hypothetical protein